MGRKGLDREETALAVITFPVLHLENNEKVKKQKSIVEIGTEMMFLKIVLTQINDKTSINIKLFY